MLDEPHAVLEIFSGVRFFVSWVGEKREREREREGGREESAYRRDSLPRRPGSTWKLYELFDCSKLTWI